jgi:hypothetical protein
MDQQMTPTERLAKLKRFRQEQPEERARMQIHSDAEITKRLNGRGEGSEDIKPKPSTTTFRCMECGAEHPRSRDIKPGGMGCIGCVPDYDGRQDEFRPKFPWRR